MGLGMGPREHGPLSTGVARRPSYGGRDVSYFWCSLFMSTEATPPQKLEPLPLSLDSPSGTSDYLLGTDQQDAQQACSVEVWMGLTGCCVPSLRIAPLLWSTAKKMWVAKPTSRFSLQITLLMIRKRKAESSSLALESSPPTPYTKSVHLGNFKSTALGPAGTCFWTNAWGFFQPQAYVLRVLARVWRYSQDWEWGTC